MGTFIELFLLLAYEARYLLIVGISLLVGATFGISLSVHAVRHMNTEEVSKKVVDDVSHTYESKIESSGLFKKFEDKIEKCGRDNLRLNQRIWNLENPKRPCEHGCEVR
jgi:hypothetical protein